MAKAKYFGAHGGNVKNAPGNLSTSFHHAAIQSLITNPEKHSVNIKTGSGGRLAVGRVISKEPLRRKGFVYQTNGKRIVKKVRIDKQAYLDGHNWHHVQTNKLYYSDNKRKRGWVRGQRVHHGAYGAAFVAASHGIAHPVPRKVLAAVGNHLVKDDIKDKFIMFEPGPGYQGAEVFRPKAKRRAMKAYRKAHKKYGVRGH